MKMNRTDQNNRGFGSYNVFPNALLKFVRLVKRLFF